MNTFFRNCFLFSAYSICALVSIWLAWQLRFGFYFVDGILEGIPENLRPRMWWQIGEIVLLKLICLMIFGQFNGLIRFFRLPDALRLFSASGTASFLLLLGWYFSSTRVVPPVSILALDFVLFTFSILGFRVAVRLFEERRRGFLRRGTKAEKVAIIGAGQVGSSLAAELFSRPELHMRPVAFFDDAVAKHGRNLHGLPIIGGPEEIVNYHASNDLDKVILAIPEAKPERIRAIVSKLRAEHIPVETVPGVSNLLDGRADAKHVLTREVNIEDLLYRDPVQVDFDTLRNCLGGKRVLVTGAGGSIGSELALQIAALNPAQILLLDRNEGSLFITENRLLDRGTHCSVRVAVNDIRDEEAVDDLLAEFKPDLIFHAAAHKHVGMMERQPREAFLNNTMGTLQLARQAIAHGASGFCLISTDKAVAPSNVMGASKRLAERALQALVASGAAGKTNFSIVRFGNVIGSSGSVIPIFERQIAERRPVTVTDPAMTRFFMTIPEAVGLVLQAVAFDEPNRLYALDMGKPISIDAMARDLIRLKGLEPDVDIPIIYTGIRPGEKLHEALHYPLESLQPTEHPKIHRIGAAVEENFDAAGFLQKLAAFANDPSKMSFEEKRESVFRLLNDGDGRGLPSNSQTIVG